jgi:hypothetical protein
LTIGHYNNFPSNFHSVESFNSIYSSKKLQEKLLEIVNEINRNEYSFEEVSIPTVPDGKVIFEFGLAEDDDFNFIDQEEAKRALDLLASTRLDTLDFFCAIRYYKGTGEKRQALKFDYYLLRTIFGKELFEIQVFHERGPRYISPEELITFLFNEINRGLPNKVLKKTSVNQ